MATKLIYGAGRIPKSSEFALGDIIVNVDDSKVYSKSKSNEVFEIGASTTSLIETQAFTTASLHTGSFDAILTASNSSNLTISGGVGIEITTGSQVNSIILNATGESIASVLVADTASYIQASNIDGTINISTQTNFNTLDTTGQTAIDLTFPANTNTLTATVPNLDTTSNVQFGSITSSTDISASGDIIASRFIASGSNTTSGFVFPNPENLTDLTSNRITLTSAQNMQFRAGNVFQFANGLVEILDGNSLLLKNDGNKGRIQLDNAGTDFESRFRIRTGSVELVTVSGSGNVGIGTTTPGKKLEVSGSISASNDLISNRLLVNDGAASTPSIVFANEPDTGIYRPAPNNLSIQVDGGSSPTVEFNFNPTGATLSTPINIQSHVTASGNISASGALFASMSTTDNSDFKTVVYDEDTGKFSITGSYSAGGQTITGTDKRVIFFDGDNNPVGDEGFTYDKNLNSVTLTGDITSSNALFPGNGAGIQLGNSAGSNNIKFVPDLNPNSAFTGEISVLAGSSDFKQSLNFVNISSFGRYITLAIGESEYFRANFNNGAKADKAFIINKDDDSVDFIVSGSNFPDLLVAGVDSDNVGIGFGSSSLSDTYSSHKLAVSGSAHFIGNITSSARIKATSAVSTPKVENFGGTTRMSFVEGGTDTVRFITNGAPVLDLVNSRVHINPNNAAGIDFRVDGDNDDYLIFADAGTEKVGIGMVNPGEKLTVDGNISASGYLKLRDNENTTGVAGALLYSASNEFYLGFS